MTPDRWQLIKDLFASALDVDAATLPYWLDTQCQGDAGLRAEVESLLLAHQAPLGMLDTPAKDRAGLGRLNLVDVLKEQQALESLKRGVRNHPSDE